MDFGWFRRATFGWGIHQLSRYETFVGIPFAGRLVAPFARWHVTASVGTRRRDPVPLHHSSRSLSMSVRQTIAGRLDGPSLSQVAESAHNEGRSTGASAHPRTPAAAIPQFCSAQTTRRLLPGERNQYTRFSRSPYSISRYTVYNISRRPDCTVTRRFGVIIGRGMYLAVRRTWRTVVNPSDGIPAVNGRFGPASNARAILAEVTCKIPYRGGSLGGSHSVSSRTSASGVFPDRITSNRSPTVRSGRGNRP
jgi:hypothetical protein